MRIYISFIIEGDLMLYNRNEMVVQIIFAVQIN
jgi:hypothetical protein